MDGREKGGGSKKALKRNFDRAAATYDRFADVQIEVAERLAAYLPANLGHSPAHIIELGCGTGNLTLRLCDRYPSASILAVDFAAAMIERAAIRLQEQRVRFLNQDIEGFLASHRERADLIVSNATLQWIEDPEAVFASARRHLQEDGLLAFSIFGPQSLGELQQALDAVLPGTTRLAARTFKDGHELSRLLHGYFSMVDDETIIMTRDYPDVLSLLRQIRKTGTGGVHRIPLRLNRRQLEAMDTWFHKRFGCCRVSYQILFFRCLP